jgi:hypothetical protein
MTLGADPQGLIFNPLNDLKARLASPATFVTLNGSVFVYGHDIPWSQATERSSFDGCEEINHPSIFCQENRAIMWRLL